MRNNKKGFTIVELVIVIAVIAILAAVLIPTFSSVTNSARASAAQQQAKAGLDSIIALTEGTMPEGTKFIVTNSSTPKADYVFEFKGNKLQEADVKDLKDLQYYDTTKQEYAIYVTAKAINGNSSFDADAKTKVIDLLRSILVTVPSSGVADSTNLDIVQNGQDFTLQGAPAGSPTYRIYYTTDIQETMVVFIGKNS